MTPRRWQAIAAAILLLLFLADALAVQTGITRGFDQILLAEMRQTDAAHALLGPHWLLPLTIAITELGGGAVRLPLTIGAVIVLLLRRRKRDALLLGGAVASGAIVLPIVKALFDRARPDLVWHLVAEHDYSFPSGHSMGSMILYSLLGWAITRRGPWAWLGVAIALAVGLTRMLLGVHWGSDVLGGWLLGGAWALAAVAAFKLQDGNAQPRASGA